MTSFATTKRNDSPQQTTHLRVMPQKDKQRNGGLSLESYLFAQALSTPI